MAVKPPALTSDENTALAGVSAVKTYLVQMPIPDAVTATARINQATFTWPLADLTVDGTSGNWLTFPRVGMLVLIGTTAGARDIGAYYVRALPTATVLKLGEIGQGDSGQVTMQDRSASIVDNAYVTIVEAYNLFARKPRITYSFGNEVGTYYKDYDLAYTDQNTKPVPRVIATDHFIARLATGASTYSKLFLAIGYPWLSSQSVSSYAWTIPGSWTVTAGATNTNTFTASIPEGKYTIYCVVTLDDGATKTIIRHVVILGSTTTPIEVYKVSSDTRDLMGRKVTVDLFEQDRASVDDLAITFIWDEVYFSSGSVATLTNQFVGWINSGKGQIDAKTRGATIEILSPAHILENTRADAQEITSDETPANWQELPAELMSADYIIDHILEYGVENYSALFNRYPPDGSLEQTINPWILPKGTTYKQIQDVAQMVQMSNAGTDSDGTLHVAQHNSYIDPADRASLTVRDHLTTDKFMLASYVENDRADLRCAMTEGYIFDGTTMSKAYSIAPDKSSGQGKGEDKMPMQIVADQDASDLLCGQHWMRKTARFKSFTFKIPGNYDVFEPVHGLRVQYTIAAIYSPTNSILTGYAIVTSVKKTRNPGGVVYMEVTIEPETEGTSGVPNPPPPQAQYTYGGYSYTPYSSVVPQSALGASWGRPNDYSPTTAPASKVKFWGLAKDASGSGFRVWRRNGAASYSDISPSTGQRSTLGTPIKLIEDTRNYKKLWLLCENGIAYINNWLATTAAWGIALSDTAAPDTFDFTASNGGFTALDPANAQYTPGVGWEDTDDGHTSFGIVLPSGTNRALLSRVEVDYVQTGAMFPGRNITILDQSVGTNYSGTGTASASAPFSSSPFTDIGFNGIDNGAGTGHVVITQVRLFKGGQGISDIAVSKGGNVYWLSKIDVSGTDYVFCNYTRNNFKTISSTQIARYNANMTYSVNVSPFTPAWVWVTAGDPGAADAKVYFSSTGAVSFTAGSALNTRGGALQYPYSLPGGSKNTAAKNLLYTKGVDTNFQAVRDGFSPATVSAGSSDYSNSSHSLVSYKLDGKYAAIMLKSRDLYITNDGGKTWSFVDDAPGTGETYSLTGWPTNRSLLVMGGDQAFAYTVNRGANWTDLWSEYETFRAGYGGSVAQIILSTAVGLAPVYSKAVL